MNRSQFRGKSLFFASIAMFMSPANAATAEGQSVPWWSQPGEADMTAFSALVLLFVLLFVVFHLYARFDRFVEHHNEGTPLKTTIPMLLLIALAYELLPPLSHFSILLPLALIATTLARDVMLWFEPMKAHTLKGELEGEMLEELQREHLGEHDRYGQRVQAQAYPEANAPAQEVPVEPVNSADKKPPAASEQKMPHSGGETDRD
ncbi:hypothetical protein [uncultured Roseibium sp.]|uniref:hypothetical protein n=1 Tax=uncultured Roseibium sp. TaxID=1936171 RepID=UPI003216E6ED